MRKKKLQKKYDKLKENHDMLVDDLYTMLKGSFSDKCIVKLKYEMFMAVELAAMSGDGTSNKPNGLH